MPPEEPSNPVLAERIGQLERNVIGRLDELKTQMSRMEDKVVWRDTYQADQRATVLRFENVEEDIGDLADRQTWTFRTAVIAVIAPIVVGVVLAILFANIPAGPS